MTLRAPRLLFGLDPLIAEARQRARRRNVLLATAVVMLLIGGGATAGGFLVSQHYHSRTAGGPVAVLVAHRMIQQGTTYHGITSGGAFEVRDFPSSQVLSGAISDAMALTGKVARVDIPPGSQLTAADFGDVGPPASPNRGYSPTGDRRAVIVTPSVIAGTVTGGSRVDVSVTMSGRSLRLRDMRVLDTTPSKGTVTLEATPRQIQPLVYAARHTNARLLLQLHN